jgi:sugar phosphate isomerase/epimerase
MNRVLSTHVCVNHRLSVAWLNRAMQAGVPAVEIFCARQHIDYRNRSQVAELGHWFGDAELKLHSIHAPMYTDEIWGRSGPQAALNICHLTKATRMAAVDEIKRALDIAELVPFRYMVQHLGVGEEEFDERKIDAAFSSLEELMLFARHRGVEILLENIPNELATATRLMSFIKLTHLDLNFVFDVGHANISGGIESEFDIMKERIRSTHIHDNDGKSDSHLFPMVAEGGTVDWKQTMTLLRSRPGQYPLLLELKEVATMEHPLDAVNVVFDGLEGLRDD